MALQARRSKSVIQRAQERKCQTATIQPRGKKLPKPEKESGWHIEQSSRRRFGCLRHSEAGGFSCPCTAQPFDGRVGLGGFRAPHVSHPPPTAQLVAEPLRLVLGETETHQGPRSSRHRGKVLFKQQRVEKCLRTDEESHRRN